MAVTVAQLLDYQREGRARLREDHLRCGGKMCDWVELNQQKQNINPIDSYRQVSRGID
jgi:hypothetical protein